VDRKKTQKTNIHITAALLDFVIAANVGVAIAKSRAISNTARCTEIAAHTMTVLLASMPRNVDLKRRP